MKRYCDWDGIVDNAIVNFGYIFDLECESSLLVTDCGMSGKDKDLRWFVIKDLITGAEKNLYTKLEW